ncbi:MAG: hypothetical protein COB24_09965 [Hyphomicrobiales bacterium]|nr:MAG: hypothetical protein COB24_09965 [Hyphomicrobiales bacterium]
MAKKTSKSRKLTAQEQSLWQKVTKDVIGSPKQKPRDEQMPDILPDISLRKPKLRKNLKSTAASIKPPKTEPLDSGYLLKLMKRFDQAGQHSTAKSSHLAGYQANNDWHEKPQNIPLDRNIRQKLQRGGADVEARLDLHGFNRNNAQTKLMSFLRSSWQQGLKTVIVVTGKGDGSIARHSLHSADFFQMPEQRAVLRASIGDWLNSAEAAPFVIGWQPAHPKHGGGGAVYVRIRSKRRH